MFITALFTIAKAWNQPKCPLTDEWTKKTRLNNGEMANSLISGVEKIRQPHVKE